MVEALGNAVEGLPAVVVLYGTDIKLADSLSLLVNLPMMVVACPRYARKQVFVVMHQELRLIRWMDGGRLDPRRCVGQPAAEVRVCAGADGPAGRAGVRIGR